MIHGIDTEALARDYIEAAVEDYAGNYGGIGEAIWDDAGHLPEKQFTEVQDEVDDLVSKAVVTVSWPEGEDGRDLDVTEITPDLHFAFYANSQDPEHPVRLRLTDATDPRRAVELLLSDDVADALADALHPAEQTEALAGGGDG